MSTPDIRGFEFDETNERKFAAHKLSAHQVDQVLDNRHVVVPNRSKRRGTFLVIGLDHGGGCLTVPVEPTSNAKIWRPITAWRSKNHEKGVLSKKGGKSS